MSQDIFYSQASERSSSLSNSRSSGGKYQGNNHKNLNTKTDSSSEKLTLDIFQEFHLNSEISHEIIWHNPNLMWFQNQEGIYILCNKRFADFLGIPASEIIGKRDAELQKTPIKTLVESNQGQAIAKGLTYTYEKEITFSNDGHCEILEISLMPIYKKGRHLSGVLGIGHNITAHKKNQDHRYAEKHAEILRMIATGATASVIYDEIALMYEARHPGIRCSMLELENGRLLHGGAPSLPKEYCEAVHGLQNGPNVGSCGTSTYTGKRVLVKDIATDPKWENIKHVALPHGLRCCWSEPIKSSSGEVLGAFGMYYNHPALPNEYELNDLISAAQLTSIVMERDQAQKRIRQLAFRDTLTGLASRANFYQVLEDSINLYKRYQHRFSLLYIDLDDFKGVNDSLGHDAGDILLQEIAQRLLKVSRKLDCVARLSGDEFCILLKEVRDQYTAAAIARRCLDFIAQPVEICGRYITPACSIGIANYPEDGQDLSTLLKAADTSLYAAKEKGKNQYVFYQPELTQKAEYRFQIEQYLRQAIEHQELSLVYQPQIQLNTGKIVGVEALSRWHHPQLGDVSPSDFITTAERIGMIKPLTKWVLNTACKQLVKWREAGFLLPHISVNISADHFLKDDFVSLVKGVLNATNISPQSLSLEVTESVIQTNPGNLQIFQELKELGVLLAIDDFGTGYSSFASLKHLTIDFLKLDKYFIEDMTVNRKSQILLSSMIEMGHNLGQGIIAEGVETAEQFLLLHQFGCEVAQGYFFSKPIDARAVLELSTRKIYEQNLVD